jgi:hypothetical protein
MKAASSELIKAVMPNSCSLPCTLQRHSRNSQIRVHRNHPFESRLRLSRGQFGPVVDFDYMTRGFAQFQMDKDGKRNLLRLSTIDGQPYEVHARIRARLGGHPCRG